MSTWLIVGATHGLGLEFVRQLLRRGDRVLATTNEIEKASQLWTLAGASPTAACRLLECDVTREESIIKFVDDLMAMIDVRRVDYVVLNTGILRYPNGNRDVLAHTLFLCWLHALNVPSSFNDFADHLKNNTIGPIIVAQNLIKTRIPIGTIIFMSSDSGSATEFRIEDGFAAYASSKAALNHMLRHMAAELRRENSYTIILAIHPGEVATDVAGAPLGSEVDGIISTEQSVSAMLQVISTKTLKDSGTFWTWEGKRYPW